MRLEVKHRSDEQLEETLKEVSSPQSSSYGHYWSLNASRFEADLRPSYVLSWTPSLFHVVF